MTDVEPVGVVVDPNVLVSAAIGSRTCREVVRLATDGAFRLITSPLLLAELRGVLGRDRFLRWRTRAQLDAFIEDIEAAGHPDTDPPAQPAVGRDPSDSYLVALTKTTGAALLCSGDRDLLDVDLGIRVLSPADLLVELHLSDGP